MNNIAFYNNYRRLSALYKVNQRTFVKMIEPISLDIKFCESKNRCLTIDEIKTIIIFLGLPDQVVEVDYFKFRNIRRLGDLYSVNRETMRRWLRKIGFLNTYYQKRIFTPSELNIIIDKFGPIMDKSGTKTDKFTPFVK